MNEWRGKGACKQRLMLHRNAAEAILVRITWLSNYFNLPILLTKPELQPTV